MSYYPEEDAVGEFLYHKFGLNNSGSCKTDLDGGEYSTGFMAYDWYGKKVFLVGIHGELDPGYIDDLEEKIDKFPDAMDLFRDFQLFGMVAAAEVADELREEVLKRGFYLARLLEDDASLLPQVRMEVPRQFQPIDYGLDARRSRKKKKAKAKRKLPASQSRAKPSRQGRH